MDCYKKLFVWQRADELAHQVYDVTQDFPDREKFGLTSQLQRAAVSVALNLVEGSARQNKKETRQFANIALGSLAETEYLLGFCKKRGFLTEERYGLLRDKAADVGKLLWGFYRSF